MVANFENYTKINDLFETFICKFDFNQPQESNEYTAGLELHRGQGLRCPALGLGAPSKVSQTSKGNALFKMKNSLALQR